MDIICRKLITKKMRTCVYAYIRITDVYACIRSMDVQVCFYGRPRLRTCRWYIDRIPPKESVVLLDGNIPSGRSHAYNQKRFINNA